MITYMHSIIDKESLLRIQDILFSSTSWRNLRVGEKPPYMLELGDQEQRIARELVNNAISNETKIKLQSIAELCAGYNLPEFDCSYLNFFKYETGAGLGIHSDVRPPDEIEEGKDFCSVVIYLNDGYLGGVFRAYPQSSNQNDFHVSPQPGSAVLMNNRIRHESTNIESGNKYIAVMHWFDRKS